MSKAQNRPDRAPPLGYTVQQAAALLQISRHTVYRLAAHGKLEMRKPGSRHMITAKSLRKLMEAAK